MIGPLKPESRIRISGRDLPPSTSNPLVRIVVNLDMEQAALATLTFGGLLEKDVKLGDRLEIDLGWRGARVVAAMLPPPAPRGTAGQAPTSRRNWTTR